MDIFAGLLMVPVLIGMFLLPSIGAALLLEWGFSRWEHKRFSWNRFLTILILAIGARLLFR